VIGGVLPNEKALKIKEFQVFTDLLPSAIYQFKREKEV
jgi:hypothetical protein